MPDDIQTEKVYEKFLAMLENRNTPSTLRAPETPPDWLDKEACRKGREYYFSYSAATSISSMEALLLGFCIPNFYKPLIVSRKSHVKEDATTRLLSILCRMPYSGKQNLARSVLVQYIV